MGFFDFIGDAFDIVTTPIRAVGSLVGDIAGGRNIADSIASSSGRVLGAVAAPLTLSTQIYRPVLDSDAARTATFGLSGDAVAAGDLNAKQLTTWDSLSQSDARRLAGSSAKLGAVFGGAYAGASALGVTGGLAGGNTALALSKGDVGGALAAGAGLVPGGLVPQNVLDAAGVARDVWNSLPKPAPGAPTVSGSPLSTLPGAGAMRAGTSSGTGMVLLAAAGVGAFLLLRGRR